MNLAPLKIDEIHEGTVSSLAYGGEGIVRFKNFVIFIPFTIPGDKLRFKVLEVKKTYARAEINKILEPSPNRIKAPCPIYHECGGCQLQEYSYATSLAEKSNILKAMLEHGLGISTILMEAPLASPKPYGYRSKMQLAINKNSLGEYAFGLYRPRTHEIVDMPTCAIQDTINNKLLKAFRAGLKKVHWTTYDEREKQGLLKHLLARSNQQGEAYVVIIATQSELQKWETFLEILRDEVPSLQGLALNINPRPTNVILGQKTKILWGKTYFQETINELQYQMAPTSFFQVNVGILESLMQLMLSWGKTTQNTPLLDLYCGVGTFSIPFAKAGASVIGIEENRESIVWARKNAERNGVHIQFYSGKSEDLLPTLKIKNFETVVVDPPRQGLAPTVIAQIVNTQPKKILYLSCNPATLTRDLKQFLSIGWKLNKIIAADFFPQTAHIESLALLER